MIEHWPQCALSWRGVTISVVIYDVNWWHPVASSLQHVLVSIVAIERSPRRNPPLQHLHLSTIHHYLLRPLRRASSIVRMHKLEGRTYIE